ncbi:MAG: type II toxin-antitoxin system VapC family toxin [Steroidobacteraceae bacterium]
MIVIDASAVIELILRTELGEKVEEWALAPDERLHAPHLLDLETAQVLRRLVQLKEIPLARAREALEDYTELFIERSAHQPLLRRIWELRESLTAYDAAYVSLAEALGVAVVTCDAKLARSHGHRARIELIE